MEAPGIGVRGSNIHLMEVSGTGLGPLPEQPALLTAEPTPAPPFRLLVTCSVRSADTAGVAGTLRMDSVFPLYGT